MKHKIWMPIVALVLFAACSTNPVTGKKEFNIVSEQQELAMGQQAHQQTISQFGIYDEKPELNRMVAEIGRELAAVSDRPNLPWQFTLLDTPMINAMALPGGYVYVTRGILERMNSRDELAGVIAHEISHVAAKHHAQRISQGQLAQLGMVLGSVLAGPAATQAYGSLAELGATLLFQRYSRQQETQADLLGTAYMAEAAYNPVGAERMLLALQRLSGGEVSSIERYFVDHPDPRKRVGDVRSQISKLRAGSAAISGNEPDRTPFVQQMAGVITGRSTLQTTIRDNTVYQRRYGIIVTAPPGWEASTGNGGLFSMAPLRSREMIGFSAQEVPLQALQGAQNAQHGIRMKLEQMGLRYLQSRSAQARTGESFPVDLWVGQAQNGQVAVETTQFVEGENAIVFMSFTQRMAQGQSQLAAIVQSMQFDRSRARAAEAPRMRVSTTRSGETWAELARRATGRVEDAVEIAEINGFDSGSAVPPRITVKLPEEVIPDTK